MKSIFHLLVGAAVLLSIGCGVSTDYTAASAPSAPYSAALAGNFAYKVDEPDARGAELTKEFASVLGEELQNTGKFSKVAVGSMSGRAIRIEGEVTYLAEGNDALRIGVGFGTGKAHFYVTARFYDNSTDALIGTYEVYRSSKQGVMGVADTFAIVRRSAAGDIAAKAAELSATNGSDL